MGISFLPQHMVEGGDFVRIADGMTLEVVGSKYEVIHRKEGINTKTGEKIPESNTPCLVLTNVRRDQEGDDHQYRLEIGLGKKYAGKISADGNNADLEGGDEPVGLHKDSGMSRFILAALEKGGPLFTEADAAALVNNAKSLIGMVWVAQERSGTIKRGPRTDSYSYIAPGKILAGPGGRKAGAKGPSPKAEAPSSDANGAAAAVLGALRSVLSEKFPDGVKSDNPVLLAAVMMKTPKPYNTAALVKSTLQNPEALAEGSLEGGFSYDIETGQVKRA